MRVLLLNASYEPLNVISWKRAICLWYDDKVEIVRSYPDKTICSPSIEVGYPAVVKLSKYRHMKFIRRRIRFSSLNIFARDNFTCMYCGEQPKVRNLTKDHVVPRSRGGATTWTNITTACNPCNLYKADRTPEEAGMKLKELPCRPTPDDHTVRFGTNLPKEWEDFITKD